MSILPGAQEAAALLSDGEVPIGAGPALSTRARGTGVAPVSAARRVVLAVLAVNVVWIVGLPVALTGPGGNGSTLALWCLLTALGVSWLLTVWAAVTPWWPRRVARASVPALLVLTAAAWPLTYLTAKPGEEPWAWLAGAVMGVLPLVLRWRSALALGSLLPVASALGAWVFSGSVVQNLAFTIGTASAVVLMGQILVWLLRLLVAAEAGREAEALLAVSHERLRLAQELHDLLGHQLTVIALKAEVASNAALHDETARAEADQIRLLAHTTLRDVRRVVAGYGAVDLTEQLRVAGLVLRSAGIRAVVAAGPTTLDAPTSQLVAAVIREAVTNILQHSQAERVDLALTQQGQRITLSVMNDGTSSADVAGRPRVGTGLAGLAHRCAQTGARLSYGRRDRHFEVRLELSSQ